MLFVSSTEVLHSKYWKWGDDGACESSEF